MMDVFEFNQLCDMMTHEHRTDWQLGVGFFTAATRGFYKIATSWQ